MRVEKITYQKSFVIGPYLQERVGVEIEVVPGDDPNQVFEKAKNMVEKWHTDTNPHLLDQPEIPYWAKPQEDKTSEVDEELSKFMEALATFTTKESAEHFLSISTFKLYRPARQFIEEKFKTI